MKLTPAELRIFREMSPADKLRQVASMYLQAKEWKRAALKKQHEDWSDEQIDRRLKEVFLYGSG
jgi:hypothetical protein